jgi:Polyketide cyclase / dehydrase and lipid transport
MAIQGCQLDRGMASYGRAAYVAGVVHRWGLRRAQVTPTQQVRAHAGSDENGRLPESVLVDARGGDRVAVRVSRRIGAPAAVVFGVLADPGRHIELDGSGMLRGAVTTTPISAVGDVFVMRMFFAELGDYEMNNHVVEYEPGRRIGWEPEAGRGHPGATGAGGSRWGQRWSYELVPDGPGATIVTEVYDCSRAPAEARADMDDGEVWAEAMATTLERLEAACTRTGSPSRSPE